MVNGENADRVKVDPSRREFTAASISALFVGMGVTLTGCGGGGGSSATGPSNASAPTPAAPTGSKSGSISGNHGHSAVVTAAQLQTGGAVSIDIQGAADHPHNVELSADQVRQIASGSRVSKVTPPAATVGEYGSSGMHEHTVTFN
jgi:hypothetical protein